MVDDNNKDDEFELIEVLENVAVLYKRGKEKKEVFDAIHINENGIFTGYILKTDKIKPCNITRFTGRLKRKSCINCSEEFIECGFIPKHNIKNIEGSSRRMVYKKKS